MNQFWEDAFDEVPASFEARMRSAISSLEETPKVSRFRLRPGSLIAAVLVQLGDTLATIATQRAVCETDDK